MVKIGSIYNSNNYGPVEVIGKSARTDYYIVRFLKTKTVKEFRSYQIKNGCIRDPFAKNVCGVACTGNIKTNGLYKAYYSIWHDMINRCYNINDKRYDAYRSVSVADDWLIFENFYHDVRNIDGFEDELIQAGALVLDKDIKQRWFGKKIYSKDTCVWIDKSINNQIQDGQQRPFVAISPDGLVFNASNISAFAREHNLERKHISGVLHKRCNTTRGWRFSYKEIV